MCDIKARQAINKFINNGSTIAREKVVFDNFESLALSWFESYKLTVKANSIRSVKNYLKVYILPAIGTYVLPKITPMLLQSIVNEKYNNTESTNSTDNSSTDNNTESTENTSSTEENTSENSDETPSTENTDGESGNEE